MKINFLILFFLSLCSCSADKSFVNNWSRFQGPNGDGIYKGKSIAVKWSAKSKINKINFKGQGQSTPVIWNDLAFITSSSQKGDLRFVICINWKQGLVLWQREIKPSNDETLHKMNSYASSSCVVDGRYVCAFFGSTGMYCFDMQGKKIWSKKIGVFKNSWGSAASPIIYKNTVIQNCDAIGKSSIVALELSSGQLKWKTDRQDTPRGGWATPIVIDYENQKQLILNGEYGVNSYNPETGKDIWFCKGFNGRGTPTPAFDGKCLYVINGKKGDIYSIKPGGKGDVTKSHMLWHRPRRGVRDIPSPVLANSLLFVTSMRGAITCYQPKTGDILWSQKLRMNISASPLVFGNYVYFLFENGQTSVIKASAQYELLHKNVLNISKDEIFRSSMAASQGYLFFRSQSTLYCLPQQ